VLGVSTISRKANRFFKEDGLQMDNIKSRRLYSILSNINPVTICIFSVALILVFLSFFFQYSVENGKTIAQTKPADSIRQIKDKISGAGPHSSRERPHPAVQEPDSNKKSMVQKALKLQMPFIANEGQAADDVSFYAQTFGGTAHVTKSGEIVYSFNINESEKTENKNNSRGKPPESETKKSFTLKETLVGASIMSPQGQDRATANVNYFIGNDKSKWKTNIPAYNTVSLGEIYEGIDLSLKAYGKTVEKVFTVRPSADPGKIRLEIEGAESISINEKGELELKTGAELLRFSQPVAFQEIRGKRQNVQVAYGLSSDTYGFITGNYDKSVPLVIDPVLRYSTYLGGSKDESGESGNFIGIAIDGSGNAYVSGTTQSIDFPTENPIKAVNESGRDVFVTKISSDGISLIYSTYLGGAQNEDGSSLEVDINGNAYITGTTDSEDFPTVNPLQPTKAGQRDVFVANVDFQIKWNQVF
jgi:hypothetical protein